jgi:hypothetical protein
MRKKPSVPMTVLGAASVLSLAGAPAEAQTGTKAGVAGAVRGPVQQVSFRTPSATVGRNVASGDEIFLGDRIVTGPAGGLQIMLLDGTTFSVGPNSSMVIDEFVYNPATGAGKITASLARGTLRLISGRIGRQEQEAIRIKLPTATVGVRGSITAFWGSPNGFYAVLLGVGPNNEADRPPSFMIVYLPTGEAVEFFRSGWGCLTTFNPTCVPQPIGPEELQRFLDQVGGSVRFIDLNEFLRLTGLDLDEAKKLLQTQGGFEELWKKIAEIFQSQDRPGNFVPPPPPPPNGSGVIFN